MVLPTIVDNGLVAGARLCDAEYPRAHLCTVYELLASIGAGRLDGATPVPRSWVYAPAWSRPLANPEQPEAGLADTCASYTYPLGARRWTGVAMEWSELPTGVVGLRLHGGAEASCYEELPLACCR